MQRKTLLRWWFGTSIMLGCLLWALTESQSFRDCIKERKNHKPYQELHKEGTLFVKSVRLRLELHSACGIISANENTGAVTAIAGVIVAIFTGTLWWVTWGMVEIAKNQRLDTLRTIKAAEDAARAAKISAEIAAQHQRPWLFISIDITELMFSVDSKSIKAKYWFENYGESIALIDYYYIDIEIGDIPHEPRPLMAQRCEFSESYVRPGGKTVELEVVFPRIISEDEVRRIRAGDTRMWIVGFIVYRDIFEDNHQSRYCYSYDPEIDIFVRARGRGNRNT